MNEEQLRNIEYSALHYGCTPTSFTRELQQSIQSIYEDVLNVNEKNAIEGIGEEASDEIKETFKKAQQLLDKSTQQCINRLNPSAMKFFKIPESVSLSVYKKFENKTEELKVECDSLEKKYLQQKNFIALLQKEKEEMEMMLTPIKKLVESANEINENLDKVAEVVIYNNKLNGVLSEQFLAE
ncbi:PREDICTED: uncharacterized protein LOC108560965 [Nicrophorus vespilloides]|uniref:Uncharacterized protein LOC108560965 n=1 Tax=Nicrophorus vespilloides TaxID=110193 RepID=A0ABM1MHZ3_NICVS|nr:PREDICTED: uncharacterized protein LOC108560965 [Nicrophorus vespilloides]